MLKNKVAVAYRIPMRVTTIFVYRNGNAYPLCPNCKITLEREYQNYCDRCGQALDWKQYRRAIVSYL